MPKINIDYSKTVIYKIVCDDENVDFIYVGSTTNFTKRKCAHKNRCNNINGKEYNQKKYVQIRENGGWENFKMIEVEKYPCNNKREAEKKEEEVRLELKANMNMIRCYITEEEKKVRDAINRKANREANIERFKQREQLCRDNNKDLIKIRNKNYREENDARIKAFKNVKHNCECGGKYTHCHKALHLRSIRHQNYLKTIIP